MKLDTMKIFYLIILTGIASLLVYWVRYSGNPVLSAEGDWSWVGSPSVIKVDDTYYMYHDLNNGTNTYMGVSTSSDGLTWSQYGDNPVLWPQYSWESKKCCNPTAWHNGTHFLVWYEGYTSSTDVSIGFASSTDGFSFTKRSTPVLVKYGSGWEARLVATPAVVWVDPYYYLCYEGLTSGGLAQLGMARSTDGITWTRGTHNPTIPVGGSGEWDEVQTNNPGIFYNGSHFLVFYAAKSVAGAYEIGLTTSTIWDDNYAKHPENPLIKTGSGWESARVLNPSRPIIDPVNSTVYRIYYTGYDGSVYRIGLVYTPTYPEGVGAPTVTTQAAKGIDWDDCWFMQK